MKMKLRWRYAILFIISLNTYQAAFADFTTMIEPSFHLGLGAGDSTVSTDAPNRVIYSSSSDFLMNAGAGMRLALVNPAGIFWGIEANAGVFNGNGVGVLGLLGLTLGWELEFYPLRISVGYDPVSLYSYQGWISPPHGFRIEVDHFVKSSIPVGLRVLRMETPTSEPTTLIQLVAQLNFPLNMPKEPWKERYLRREMETH